MVPHRLSTITWVSMLGACSVNIYSAAHPHRNGTDRVTWPTDHQRRFSTASSCWRWRRHGVETSN